MYKLKDKYKLTALEKKRIGELDLLFFENDHAYLRGKRLPERFQNEIASLYYDKLGDLHVSWMGTLLEIELLDLKKDAFCKGNSNKNYWVMAYMLRWLADLGEELTLDEAFLSLRSREATRQLILHAYEKV